MGKNDSWSSKVKTNEIRDSQSRLGWLSMLSLVMSLGAGSAVADVLPDPTTVVGGVPVAVQYDDAYSYSTRVLDYLYPTGGWDTSAGTGLLDILVTTRSSGQTNPAGFPDPITNPNTDPINDSWGTADTSGDLLVKTLYNYLLTNFNTTIPTFTFDQNETGGNPDLFVTAKVEIIDPTTGVLYTWSMDLCFQAGDGSYDANCLVTAPGTIIIPDVMNTCVGDTCTFSNNVGSGAFDYIVLVPTMDLTPWVDDDNLFKVTWSFNGVDDGGEEITITGRFSPGSICETDPTAPGCQVIPEPDSLALFGLALIGFFAVRRRARLMLVRNRTRSAAT
jgi:hypothetical protein